MGSMMKWLNIWWPAMLMAAVIMLESTPFFSGEHTGRWLISLWTWLFGSAAGLPWAEINLLLRKTGHVMGYGLASLAFLRSWRLSLHQDQMSVWRRLDMSGIILALLSVLVLASADEFHQSFLPSRTSSVNDVMLDMLGASVAQVLLFLYAKMSLQATQVKAG